MTTKQTAHTHGLEVIAHGPEEFHLVRDGYFASWAHVHRAESSGGKEEGSVLHLDCEHSLVEVLSVIPADTRGEPLLAHARLVVTLAEQAQTTLVKGTLDADGELKALPSSTRQRLLGSVSEAAETLSALSAELAEVLIGSNEQIADRRARDRATQAALAGIIVHEDLRGLFDVLSEPSSSARTGRNERCPCGSGQKYKHCCGQAS